MQQGRYIHQDKDIIREAEVAQANHYVAPESIKFPLKKIIRVVRRKAEELFVAMIMNESKEKVSDNEFSETNTEDE